MVIRRPHRKRPGLETDGCVARGPAGFPLKKTQLAGAEAKRDWMHYAKVDPERERGVEDAGS